MKLLHKLRNPYVSLGINLAYAAGNSIIGFVSRSWWFITVGAYYVVLFSARFCVLSVAQKAEGDSEMASFARKVTGYLLVGLAVCLVGINILSAVRERGKKLHEIVMIALAAYSFTKITLAVLGITRAKRSLSQFTKALRNIAFADSLVSICSLQRSMLVSFPGMRATEIQLFNLLTGTVVQLMVLCLGINLLGGKRIDMAKSGIVKVNQKIAGAVTDGYRKIEQGVVDGYKKIEQSVVSGFTKMEDRFVDAYLTHEGETIEEAKERLRKSGR